VPFNDADALASVLEKIGEQVAGLIMEPAMMNINIIPPRAGYLERVRELTAEHGVKLIFDEVKTGATISEGGATARFGVRPDMIALAKATCGGYPGGAIGMTDELAAIVADGTVKQYGTFNGNPLVMAAAEATLTEVLTDDAYSAFEETNRDLLAGCQEIIDAHGLPAYTEGLGAKGCVIFSPERMYEYRDYLTKVDDDLSTLAWLYHMNHGIFMTPGVEEEWTLSIAHDADDRRHYLDAFEAFARDVTA
jgi:glutamate-1-semialdehyde 2,1-aminomutase